MHGGGSRLANSPDRHEGREVTLSYVHGVNTTLLIPRYVRFTSEFPMTVAGKVQKFKMREITVAELALDRVTEVEPT